MALLAIGTPEARIMMDAIEKYDEEDYSISGKIELSVNGRKMR